MKKTLWIDVCNSPQVSVCEHIINTYSKQCDFIVTSRNLYNTEQLLRQKKINYVSIGKHYGKKKWHKTLGFFVRVFQLYFFLVSKNITISFSQSSFYSPLVSYFLKVKCIYTNDNEHAIGNIIAHLFADEFLSPKGWIELKFLRGSKYSYYEGCKESFYISKFVSNLQRKQSNLLLQDKAVYYRPGSWNAQYYLANEEGYERSIIEVCQQVGHTIILCRNREQEKSYKKLGFENVSISSKPKNFSDIYSNCLLFVSSGGSMTRELALLGTPTISTYKGPSLLVEKELESHGLILKVSSFDRAEWKKLINNKLNTIRNTEDYFNAIQCKNNFSSIFDRIIKNYC